MLASLGAGALVERDVARPGLEHAEEGHHRDGRLPREESDTVAGRDAVFAQRAGDLLLSASSSP